MSYLIISDTISTGDQQYVSGEARGTVKDFYFTVRPEESPSGIFARIRLYDSEKQMEEDPLNFLVEYNDWVEFPSRPLLKARSRFALTETRPPDELNVSEWLGKGQRELEKLAKIYEAIKELKDQAYLYSLRGQLKSEAEVASKNRLRRLAEEERVSARRRP